MTKIVGIIGSLRPDAYSDLAIKQVMKRVSALNTEVETIDLRTMKLPFCDGGNEYPDYPDVDKMREKVKAADGLVLVTPEYHGSVSGVLKNAIDLMSFEHFSGKVTGVMSILGGQSNSNALNDLRIIVRWMHGFVIPEQIAIGQAWQAFDKDGNLKDAKLAGRFDGFSQSLVNCTNKLTMTS